MSTYLTRPLSEAMRQRMSDFPSLIRELMARLELDQTQLGERLDVKQATVSRWLSGSEPKHVTRLRVAQLAEEAGLASTGGRSRKVAVMGRVGAGAEIVPEVEQVPADGLFEVETAFPLPDGAIAFEVEGDSMWPRYDAGDIVICWREGTSYEQTLGWEAAVRTTDGRRYLKKIVRGSEPGTVNLESHNAPAIRSVTLAWASQVHACVRAGQWRKTPRKN